MSTRAHDAAAVILGLKTHFGVKSDDALAGKLEVAKSTIATWRRRGEIPWKTAKELETRHGLTLDVLIDRNSDELREYVLRQAFYVIVLQLYRATLKDGNSQAQDADFADSLAIIEPFLRRVIIQEASADTYQGVSGAATFLIDLRSEKLRGEAIMKRAMEERRAALPT